MCATRPSSARKGLLMFGRLSAITELFVSTDSPSANSTSISDSLSRDTEMGTLNSFRKHREHRYWNR